MSQSNIYHNQQQSHSSHGFESVNWFQAMTLTERLSSLRKNKIRHAEDKLNIELANRRLRRWQSEYPFSTDTQYFQQRLATDKITEEEFKYLLGESIEDVGNRLEETPEWLKYLQKALASEKLAESEKSFSWQEELSSGETPEFLQIIAPIIEEGRQKLRQGIQKIVQEQEYVPFETIVVEELFLKQLPNKLLRMTSRTFVLELNVARLQGILTGETPAERFNSFLQHFCQPEQRLNLLTEYPVLARQLVVCINQWVNYSLEFLQHLCLDAQQIAQQFNEQKPLGLLVGIEGNIGGDSHDRGRVVLSAKFSSGLQIVYKPRSLSLDIHFQELLTWINDHGNCPNFKTLEILDRNTYGWVEFVSIHGCHSPAEIERFYERQGGYLAILYALEASDFHFDNLIASGEHPVLIDLEALFHPHLPQSHSEQAQQIADDGLNYSVLKIGLLPQRLWSNDEYEGIDLSALGTNEAQLSPDRIPYWAGAKTDEMRLERCRMEITAEQHRPTLENAQINVLDYQKSIITGFTSIYQLFVQHQEFLLSSASVFAQFGHDQTRVLLRSTRTYALLLQESFHPDVLRDALERDRLFDSLWAQVKHFPYLARTITEELIDLQHGDIPKFTTCPNSCDLWSSSGVRIRNFFAQPDMNTVKNRLQQLNEGDLQTQIWYIKASLTTLVTQGDQTRWSSYSLREPQKMVSGEDLIGMAKAVGDHLEGLALQGKDDAAWLGLKFHNEKYSSIVKLGYDLYDGIPGICLFLAYLAEATQEQRYRQLAQASLVNLRRQIEAHKSQITSIGSFNGWGGIIYTLTHLSSLWHEADLLVEAESIVNLLPNLIKKDEEYDILGGSAGCILALTGLYRSVPTANILNNAILCGDRLLSKAQQMGEGKGRGWLIKQTGNKALAGFSHGSAGIACALLELSAISGEPRFKHAALEAIKYESTLFCPEANNWLDLRLLTDTILDSQDKSHLCNTSWCHGAPGIGLARLRSLKYVDNRQVRGEIQTALKTTLQEGFGQNHSLCHGDLGNLELLLQGSLRLRSNYWQKQVTRLSSSIAESIQENGWLCGVPLKVETPGLMTGLAGIGYQLLRLAKPETVPSVLLLENPIDKT